MRLVSKIDRPIPDTLISIETQAFLSKICNANKDDRRALFKKAAPYWKGKYDDNGVTKYAVIEKLEKDLYFGKCAYCERHCQTEIEHYRPKGAVKEDKSHGGYYWLACEWTNLVPACHDCNEMIEGKGTQFPIMGNRIWSATYSNSKTIQLDSTLSPYIDEQPYLLHPEIDNPEDLFSFEWDNTGIVIKSTDEQIPNRASETIRICNLNRDSLKRHRAEVMKEEIIQNINNGLCLISQFDVDEETIILGMEITFQALQEKINDNCLTFTLLRKFVMENEANFTHLVAHYFDNKELISKAFHYFKTQTL